MGKEIKMNDIPVVSEEVKFTPEQIQEQQNKILDKLTESILFNQMALNKLHEVRYTPYYEKELKNALNRAQKQLVKAEKKHFDNFFDKLETSTQGLLKIQEELVAEITEVGLEEFENLTNVIRAFKSYPEKFEEFINELKEVK